MENLLVNSLPDSVLVNEDRFEIRPDYRTAVKFSSILMDTEATMWAKTWTALELYYPIIPPDYEAAFSAICEFYNGGMPMANRKGGRALYSFEYDAAYIYAAFYSQYGIDLQATNLHWWQFKGLFSSLGEDTEIIKIIGYRGAKINDSMSKEQKAFYRKMKKLYALPDTRTQGEKDAELAEQLWNLR